MKEAAKLMNVSERSVYMARELAAARPDLADKVAAGEMSTLGALKIAKPDKYGAKADRYAGLLRAFAACSDEEQARFIHLLSGSDD